MKLLRRIREAFSPPPRSPEPRLPRDAWEDVRVHDRWDSLNGRYYFVADSALEGGPVLRGVTFDEDTNIAVRLGTGRIPPGLFGKRLIACLLVQDRAGRHLVTREERDRFQSAHVSG